MDPQQNQNPITPPSVPTPEPVVLPQSAQPVPQAPPAPEAQPVPPQQQQPQESSNTQVPLPDQTVKKQSYWNTSNAKYQPTPKNRLLLGLAGVAIVFIISIIVAVISHATK